MNACTKDVKVRWVFLETGEVLQAFTWHMVYASKISFFFLVKIILISKLVMSLQIIQMLLYPVGFQTFLFKYSVACIEVISNTRILTVEKIIASYMILICS